MVTRTLSAMGIVTVCVLAACAGISTDGGQGSKASPSGAAAGAPHLQMNGNVAQLMVEGRPFLVLGGELRNSASTSLEHTAPIFPQLKKQHLNTVLAATSWELVEPEEGKYDFKLVDGLIAQARASDMKLVLLWFGSWKNSFSHYVPGWVKEDTTRFPRVVLGNGKTTECLSVFGAESAAADARAFAAMMRHVKAVDGGRHTVIMVQVENEVGVLGASRDHSAGAEAAFGQPVPAELTGYLQAHKGKLLPEFEKAWAAAGGKTSGTWEEVFGKGSGQSQADEVFMAWNYARYINKVVEAGKGAYALPMFVNTWIVQPQDKGPGDYPSGGAEAHVHDVWQAGAPAVDLLCPDIYLPAFEEIVQRYGRNQPAIFVPESAGGAVGAGRAFYAVGAARSIGYSPFGIEGGARAGGGGGGGNAAPAATLGDAYEALAGLMPVITKGQAEGKIGAAIVGGQQASAEVTLGGYTMHVGVRQTRRPGGPAGTGGAATEGGYAMIIATGENEFVMAGSGCEVRFAPAEGKAVGLESVDEGTYVKGVWKAVRRLNGDEVMLSNGYDVAERAAALEAGTGVKFEAGTVGVRKVKVYRY
jgi:hypothetical protein